MGYVKKNVSTVLEEITEMPTNTEKLNPETSETSVCKASNTVLLSTSDDSNQALTNNPEGFIQGLNKLYGDEFSFIEDIIRADITGLKKKIEEAFNYSKER